MGARISVDALASFALAPGGYELCVAPHALPPTAAQPHVHELSGTSSVGGGDTACGHHGLDLWTLGGDGIGAGHKLVSVIVRTCRRGALPQIKLGFRARSRWAH